MTEKDIAQNQEAYFKIPLMEKWLFPIFSPFLSENPRQFFL